MRSGPSHARTGKTGSERVIESGAARCKAFRVPVKRLRGRRFVAMRTSCVVSMQAKRMARRAKKARHNMELELRFLIQSEPERHRGPLLARISTAFPFRLVASVSLCHIGAPKAVSRNG